MLEVQTADTCACTCLCLFHNPTVLMSSQKSNTGIKFSWRIPYNPKISQHFSTLSSLAVRPTSLGVWIWYKYHSSISGPHSNLKRPSPPFLGSKMPASLRVELPQTTIVYSFCFVFMFYQDRLIHSCRSY